MALGILGHDHVIPGTIILKFGNEPRQTKIMFGNGACWESEILGNRIEHFDFDKCGSGKYWRSITNLLKILDTKSISIKITTWEFGIEQGAFEMCFSIKGELSSHKPWTGFWYRTWMHEWTFKFCFVFNQRNPCRPRSSDSHPCISLPLAVAGLSVFRHLKFTAIFITWYHVFALFCIFSQSLACVS